MLLARFHVCGMLLQCLCSTGQLGLKLAAKGSALGQGCVRLLLHLHLCQHAALCLRTHEVIAARVLGSYLDRHTQLSERYAIKLTEF